MDSQKILLAIALMGCFGCVHDQPRAKVVGEYHDNEVWYINPKYSEIEAVQREAHGWITE